MEALKKQLAHQSEITFKVRARPGASKTVVREIMDDGTVKIDVASVPEDGKANAELIRFLAKEFKTRKADVEILSGLTTRLKVIRIAVSW